MVEDSDPIVNSVEGVVLFGRDGVFPATVLVVVLPVVVVPGDSAPTVVLGSIANVGWFVVAIVTAEQTLVGTVEI